MIKKLLIIVVVLFVCAGAGTFSVHAMDPELALNEQEVDELEERVNARLRSARWHLTDEELRDMLQASFLVNHGAFLSDNEVDEMIMQARAGNRWHDNAREVLEELCTWPQLIISIVFWPSLLYWIFG